MKELGCTQLSHTTLPKLPTESPAAAPETLLSLHPYPESGGSSRETPQGPLNPPAPHSVMGAGRAAGGPEAALTGSSSGEGEVGVAIFCSPHPLSVSKNRRWIPGKRFRCVTISRQPARPRGGQLGAGLEVRNVTSCPGSWGRVPRGVTALRFRGRGVSSAGHSFWRRRKGFALAVSSETLLLAVPCAFLLVGLAGPRHRAPWGGS